MKVVRKRHHRWGNRMRVELLENRTLLSAYYVSTTGSDSAAGGINTPWRTIQHAADLAHAGDVVTVRTGNYAGFNLGWNGPQSGTATSRITFVGQAGATIVSANSRTADGIDLEGTNYVTVQGFTITNAGGTISRAGIRTVTNSNVVIRGNNVDGAGRWGIFTAFSDDVLIENNVASHSLAEHGIYVSNSGDRPVIRGNIVFGNHNCGIHMNGDASEGGDGIIDHAWVTNNVIYDNGVGGGSGINADGVVDSVFQNNVLYDNHASGISLFQTDGGSVSHNNIVSGNTIVMAADARWAINIVDGSTGNAVTNNILDNRNPGHGAINISADSRSGFISDANLIIGNHFSADDGDSIVSLAQWRSATGEDVHSVISTEAATFRNAGANDFHLLANSAAVDPAWGMNAPASDIEGNARPSGGTADIGAYEYQSDAPTEPSKLATSAAFDSWTSTSTVGAMTTFSVTVRATDGGQIPSGTATFMDGSETIGAARLNDMGTAEFSTARLLGGMHKISVLYTGDANCAASGTAGLGLMVVGADAGSQTVSVAEARPMAEARAVSPAPVLLAAVVPTAQASFVDSVAPVKAHFFARSVTIRVAYASASRKVAELKVDGASVVG